ncbi:uncharacterized protein LOC112347077 [Selaginella moellendorffii]|uniref:uncharacterized protein LOC112347077 n=1 Tax=Selaginella moellendorffii TaxID=88036 RepID=UPI000D1C5042|nr:uncharacterized protein LOC112347077 [Selaginella moellendorffii]|eukprot:XP_024533123.1 uncharacterized protein LOC112347077 [Selaginella moellendorffii]
MTAVSSGQLEQSFPSPLFSPQVDQVTQRCAVDGGGHGMGPASARSHPLQAPPNRQAQILEPKGTIETFSLPAFWCRCTAVAAISRRPRPCLMLSTPDSVFSGNIMVAAFAQNGHIPDAWQVFDAMPEKNVVSWTTIIAVYCSASHVEGAKLLFDVAGTLSSRLMPKTGMCLTRRWCSTGSPLERSSPGTRFSRATLKTVIWIQHLERFAAFLGT